MHIHPSETGVTELMEVGAMSVQMPSEISQKQRPFTHHMYPRQINDSVR